MLQSLGPAIVSPIGLAQHMLIHTHVHTHKQAESLISGALLIVRRLLSDRQVLFGAQGHVSCPSKQGCSYAEPSICYVLMSRQSSKRGTNTMPHKKGGEAFVHSWLCSLLLLNAILYVGVIDIMTSLISKTDHAVEGKTRGAACIHPG